MGKEPLFVLDTTPARQETDDSDSAIYSFDQFEMLFREGSLEKLSSIGELVEHKVIKFMSKGAWSMHELLAYLVEKTGPADVHLSAWTMSEDPARVIYKLKEEGLIKKLSCLLDYRIHTNAGDAMQLLLGITDRIALVKTHAKVMVILNKQWGISVVGSANFSRNKRIEAGTIFIHRPSALFEREWIESILNEADNESN